MSKPFALLTLIAISLAVAAPLSAAGNLPDLVVTSVAKPNAAAAAGATIHVRATIRNTGGVRIAATIARFYLSSSRAHDASAYGIATAATPAIRPGGSVTVTAAAILPTSKVGSFYVLVCANAPGNVKEAVFGNDCAASRSRITVAAGTSTGTTPAPKLAAQSALPTRSPSATLPPFKTDGYSPKQLAYTDLPYVHSQPVPLDDPAWTVDSSGLYRYSLDGKKWDHPTNMAQYIIVMVDGYRLTHQQAYLDRATRNAQRLLDIATTARGALYFPFQFVWANNGDQNDLMKPPWYSGMTNGLMLEAFDRLYDQTGDEKWKAAADKTFQALLEPYTGTKVPWVAFVDRGGYLWAEEYAKNGAPMRVFNGHMEDVYGVYDYWRITHSPVAAHIFDGLATTVREYANTFRRPGTVSYYSLRVLNPIAKYQYIVVRELAEISKMTGDPWFANESALFHNDYPAEH